MGKRKNYNEKTHGSRFRPIDCGALSRMPGPNKMTISPCLICSYQNDIALWDLVNYDLRVARLKLNT